MKKKEQSVKIISLYNKNYHDDVDGDYDAISVMINGKKVAQYYDYYHDKGDLKAEAFIQGWFKALEQKCPNINRSAKLVSDSEID